MKALEEALAAKSQLADELLACTRWLEARKEELKKLKKPVGHRQQDAADRDQQIQVGFSLHLSHLGFRALYCKNMCGDYLMHGRICLRKRQSEYFKYKSRFVKALIRRQLFMVKRVTLFQLLMKKSL